MRSQKRLPESIAAVSRRACVHHRSASRSHIINCIINSVGWARGRARRRRTEHGSIGGSRRQMDGGGNRRLLRAVLAPELGTHDGGLHKMLAPCRPSIVSLRHLVMFGRQWPMGASREGSVVREVAGKTYSERHCDRRCEKTVTGGSISFGVVERWWTWGERS